jgi:hypothetical protein
VHIIEGHFCNRVLTSSGTESGIFFIRGGESNRDWFFLKLKLDDFTSGFRTRYADMAGCWEEVVAVGGGVRTRSGTGVELDKKNEADGTSEGKILAGRAAAEQANYIWLISGETMTLNFL